MQFSCIKLVYGYRKKVSNISDGAVANTHNFTHKLVAS